MTELNGDAQTMSLVAFTAVATVTLLLCVMTGPDRDDLDEFYTGYRSLSPCATASPSRATTSPPPPSWAPAASSPSTARTVSSSPSAPPCP